MARGPGPLRSQSAHPPPTRDYYHEHISNPSPRLPPPRTTQSPRQQQLPPPPPPPPPPRLPPSPLTRSKPSTLPPLFPRHDGRRSSLAGPQYGYNDGRYSNDRDSIVGSLREADEPGITAEGKANWVQRLTDKYTELRNQRSLVLASSKAQPQGALVRELRQSKDVADEKFMTAARALLPDSAQLHELKQLFDAMHSTYRRYMEAEQHLEEIVDRLYNSQEAIESHEWELYKTAMEALGISLFDIDNDQDSYPNESEDWALRGITGDRPETFHPLYEKLRAAFGELQLARELLANTQMKREALHARKAQPLTDDGLALLENYGDAGRKKALELRAMTVMTEEDIEQLREYDELEEDARQTIEIYTERVRTLQQECKENRVLPSSSHFLQEGFGLDSFYRDEIRLVSGPFDGNDESATLAHPVFPLLLSNPTHLLHGFPQTALQSLKMAIRLPSEVPVRAKQISEAAREQSMHSLLSNIESDDKGEYINRWLLHKLHHSAMEAELLWTTIRSRLKILDIDRWQRDVLHFWWRDKSIDIGSTGVSENGTDRASKFVGSRMEFNTFSHSDSGQLNGLRDWNVNDYWP